MRTGEIVVITMGSLLAALLVVVLTSAMLQACASQTYVLTQDLFPALSDGGYEYWLDWGTLLGAQRESGMIAHDYDADIGMRESEFQRLKAAWKTDPRFRGMRLSKEAAQLYRVRRGLGWVDVFRYDDARPETLRMMSMANTVHSCKCDGAGHAVSAVTVFPLKTLRFGSVRAPAPARTADYLTHLYGADWMVPRKNLVATLMTISPRFLH